MTHSGLRIESLHCVLCTHQSLDSRVRIQARTDWLVALELIQEYFHLLYLYTSKLKILLLQSQVPSFCQY